MDLRDTPEEAAFHARVRSFLDENLPVEPGREWSGKMHAAGYAGATWPAEYGGSSLPFGYQAIILEEFARVEAPAHMNPIGLGMAGPTIMFHGTDEQKVRYLPAILSADEIWCQGFSEPGAGSDLASVRTRIEVRNDDFLVNGQKVWSSFAHLADFCILLGRSGPTSVRQAGLSYLIVDMHASGVEVRPLRQITGESEFNEIFFTDVSVPKENLLGEIGGGWQVAMTTLLHERGTLGIALTGQLDAQVHRLISLTRRVAANDPLVRDRVAREWIELQALKLTNYRTLTALEKTGIPGPEGSVAKLHWSEQNQRLTKLAMEILGGEDDGYWLYQQLRSRGNTIEAGTSEILRNIIAERVLGLPRVALMQFALSEEQEMLNRDVRRYLAERYPSPAEWDRSEWPELAKLGWTGVSVPEPLGGSGLGLIDEAVIFEEFGRAGYPGPFVTSVGLALPALDPEQLARLAAGEATYSVAIDDLSAPDEELVDEVVAVSDPQVASAVRRRGFAALALESVGIAQRVLEIGVEHARTREQFGRPIGVYQAVSHKLADSYIETELARSLAYWAAWCVSEGEKDAALAAVSAKAYATDAAVAACERSIQVLGGIGMTWEHVLHRYYKRALQIQAFGGYAQHQRAFVASALLD